MSDTAKSKVFISYSRADTAFVDDLAAGLGTYGGYQVLIDREGIGHGEDWRARLGRLILECDTMVFVLSPDSLSSEVCQWEIAEATRIGRRIIPLLWRQIDFATAPPELSAINAVPFTEGQIIRGLERMVAALDTDMGWLREHTALTERAAEWEGKGEAVELLLRGTALRAAQSLLAERPASAPKPMERLQRYLRASEEEEIRILSVERERLKEMEAARDAAEAARHREGVAARKVVRRTLIGLTASLALLAASVVAGVFALRQREEARAQKTQAEAAAAEARAQRDAALITESRFLARTAQEFLSRGDAANALGFARAGLPSDPAEPDRPVTLDPAQAIFDAWGGLHEVAALRGHTRPIRGAAAQADGKILTWSRDGTVRRWGADGREELTIVAHRAPEGSKQADTGAHGLIQLAGGRYLTWGVDKTAKVWTADGALERELIRGETWPRLQRLSDGRILAVVGEEMRLYDASLALVFEARSAHGAILEAVELSGGRFATRHLGGGARNVVALWGADGAPGAALRGHQSSVRGVVELTGGRLVTWDNGGALRFWSADGSALVRVVEKAHGVQIRSLLPLPDGRLFSWGQDGFTGGVWSARIWTPDGAGSDFITDSDEPLAPAPLSGGRLLIGANSTAPRIWTLDGRAGTTLRGHEAGLLSVDEWPDGRIVTTGRDGLVGVWSAEGAPIRLFRGHEGAVLRAVRLGADRLVSYSVLASDLAPRIWSIPPTQRARIPLDSFLDARSVRLLSEGFAAATSGSATLVWDGEGREAARLGNDDRGVDGALRLADGRLLSWRRNDGQEPRRPALRLHSASGERLEDWLDAGAGVAAAFEGVDGGVVVFTTAGEARRFQADGTALGTQAGGLDGRVWSAFALPAGGGFLTMSDSGGAQLWGADGAPRAVLLKAAGPLGGALRHYPLGDGRFALTFAKSAFQVFEGDGRLAMTAQGDGAPFGAITGLSDGRVLALALDGRARIYGADGALTETRDQDYFSPFKLTRLVDGRVLLVGRDAARVFDRGGAPTAFEIPGDVEVAAALADGGLATWPAEDGSSVQLWGADGSRGPRLRGHRNDVLGILQMPDGRILSWSETPELRIWPGSIAQATAWAEDRIAALRPLSRAERCAYYLEDAEACAGGGSDASGD